MEVSVGFYPIQVDPLIAVGRGLRLRVEDYHRPIADIEIVAQNKLSLLRLCEACSRPLSQPLNALLES